MNASLPAPLRGGVLVIPDADVPANRGIAAMFSSTVRNDNWVLPRLLRVLAMVGNVELDLSQVRMGLGVSTDRKSVV